MKALRHYSLRVWLTNAVSEVSMLPGSPDMEKYSGGPLPTCIDGKDSHIIMPHLQPTFGEGGLGKDERLVLRCRQPRVSLY